MKLKSGSDKRIIFLGFQNQLEMPTLYRTCDLFILPSTGPGETWGLALNEAMAAGRPIISTFKTGGAIDLIDESHNGIIIAPGDVNSAVKFVEALRADKAAWQRASATSTERINNFAYNIIVKAIEAHLQKL